MIAGEVALMVALAMAVSVPGLLAVARLLSEVLFSVNATDPAILAALVAVITAIAAAAAFAPARRAMALDPVQALQHE
jgi:ABC-type antimicrobial peptide transport system permease subunit